MQLVVMLYGASALSCTINESAATPAFATLYAGRSVGPLEAEAGPEEDQPTLASLLDHAVEPQTGRT